MGPNEGTSIYSTTGSNNLIRIDGTANWGWGSGIAGSVEYKNNQEPGYHPLLAFKYIKKKFGMLEKIAIDRRLKKLEIAFNEAVDNGQNALGEKLLREMARESRETLIYAKGIRHFVERDDIQKVKHNIKGGHISDTRLEEFTKIIPKDVMAEKKKVEGVFDGFVIYHYYNRELEKKIEKKQKMSEDEKSKMRDPILFGWINECDRLYFVADWEDEHCDLTFDEIVDVLGEDKKLTKYPKLEVKE